jgi:hypothetical protein
MTIAGYQFEKNASDSRGLLHVLLPSGFLPDEIVYQYQEKSLYLKYPKVSDDRVSITWLFRDHGFGTIVLAAVRRSKKPHQLTWRELDARVPLPYEVSGASWHGAVDEAMRLGVPLNSRNNKRLVFSLHGIESRGAWQKDLSNAFVTHATKADYLTPIALDYGRVRFSRLLSPWFRRAKVTDFLNSYCEWTRRALDARPSIIAHSFGTYVVARSLEM